MNLNTSDLSTNDRKAFHPTTPFLSLLGHSLPGSHPHPPPADALRDRAQGPAGGAGHPCPRSLAPRRPTPPGPHHDRIHGLPGG